MWKSEVICTQSNLIEFVYYNAIYLKEISYNPFGSPYVPISS